MTIKNKKCFHNIKNKNNTIILLEGFKTMVEPDVIRGVCKICGRPFEFESNKIRKEDVFDDVDDGRNEKET